MQVAAQEAEAEAQEEAEAEAELILSYLILSYLSAAQASAGVPPVLAQLPRRSPPFWAAMSRCRLKEWYNVVVRPDLMAKMQYTNTHAIPKLSGVSVQVTTKQAATGLDNAVPAAFILELVTGQTAALTRVKNANAMYKVRPGHLEGAKVTLHGDQMYHFLDRMVTQVRLSPSPGAQQAQLRGCARPALPPRCAQVLPRITDFNGLNSSSFDGKGNYALPIKDWSYFLEVRGPPRPIGGAPGGASLRNCAPSLHRSRRSTPTCNTSTCRGAPASACRSTPPRKRTTRRSCC